MKNNIMKTVIVLITLAMFSGAFAQSVGDGNSSGATNTSTANQTADSSNQASNGNVNSGNVTNNYAAEDTRGIGSPIQTRNEVRYSGEYDVNTVPDVSAPGLTTTLTETCMGSTSAGGAVVGFGFSFGTTWRDSACVRRLDSRQLMAIGYQLGAKELMCDSDKIRNALMRAGKPCFADLPEELREEINPTANAVVLNQEVNQRSKDEYNVHAEEK